MITLHHLSLCLIRLGGLRTMRATILALATLCVAGAAVTAEERPRFEAVSIAEVRLYSFIVATGQMVPEDAALLTTTSGDVVETKTFAFPLDRHFIIGLRFEIRPGRSSGYQLPERDAVRVQVAGRARAAWRNFYLHGQTYMTPGTLSKTASAWKFVTLDLVCDPTDVDVFYRTRRLKRIRVNGRCPE